MKRYSFFAVLCLVPLIFLSHCYAQETGSLDLLNNAKQYDNKTIDFKGEVIGDVMIREDHAWLHVNDGYIAIGIWAPKTLIADIRYAGDYHTQGDIVEVSGTFHRACLEHGGDLDIHAVEIKKVASGSPVIRAVNSKKVYLSWCFLLIVLLVYPLKKFFSIVSNRRFSRRT